LSARISVHDSIDGKCSVSATLKHVAKTVAHVDLSDHVINVVFTIFDENRKLNLVSVFEPFVERLKFVKFNSEGILPVY
jgi:hypothetical protein